MITYSRNEDGTYTKAGEFVAAPDAVSLWVEGSQPFGEFPLVQAVEIVETAIDKKQVKAGWYKIVLVAEKAAVEPKTPRAPKEPKPPKAPKEPKAPKVQGEKPAKTPKYDVEIFYQMARDGKTVKEIMAATGASDCFVKFKLKTAGLLPDKKKEAGLHLKAEADERDAKKELTPGT